MNKEFFDYLKDISVSDVVIARIKLIIQECQMLSPGKIQDIFMNDFITDDGTREYDSLYLFTDSFVMEAKQFTTTDDYDLTLIKNTIYYWTLNKKDFDLVTPSEKSRLYIRINLESAMGAEFKGSKNNCIYLMQIFKKYILPNFKV